MSNIDYESPHWGPFVMKTKVSEEFCNEMLTRAKKCKTSHNKNLAGHLKSQFKYDDTDKRFFYDTLYPYFDNYIKEEARWFEKDLPKNDTVPLKPEALWVNFMKAGDFNPPHYHGGDYSFVLYIDIPKDLPEEIKNYEGQGGIPGAIDFTMPAANININNYKCLSSHQYSPLKRDFFIFSAHTYHMVYPFKCKGNRVSISGNLTRKKPL